MTLLPPNFDDLTLSTDPVTGWALSCLAFGVGVGILNLVLVVMSL